ncbi:outer membrane beta-barrel protein [Oceanospirillaceae bacterium ASx5O]|nr:outer membrane beta-barrel protein [Oceanospirillaceae bacterium ASx5O]
MQPMVTLRNTVSIATVSALLALSPLANAQRIEETPSAGAMVADAVVVRPVYFLLSQVGAAVYAVTLPFTLLGGNADQAAETLVVTPLQAGFIRCLGCRQVDNQVSRLSDSDGSKRIQNFVMLTGSMSLDDSLSDNKYVGGGVYMGTHFALSDRSRFDVMLGGRYLGDSEKDVVSESIISYEVVSRFGVELAGWLEVSGKLGLNYINYEADLKAPGLGKIDSSDAGFFWGVGAATKLSDNWRLGLDYSRYDFTIDDDVLTMTSEDVSLDTVDLNLTYFF